MKVDLVVCDLDNTLYDWVSYFVPAFYAMVDSAVEILQCDRSELLDDLRDVHREHHDSEYPFALLDAATVRKAFPNKSRHERAALLDPAFHAFNRSRKELLRTYPGVEEGLNFLATQDIPVVAHTESNLFAVADRLSRLKLTRYFRRFYCRERPESNHPNPTVANEWLASFPLSQVVELRKHQRKPDPDVLLEICRREGVEPAATVYVGDSMVRDVLAAKSAGVFSVWAKYGSTHSIADYERLVRISHWSTEDVDRERNLLRVAQDVKPDYVLGKSFAEIIGVITAHPLNSNE